jgi:TRAP-type mannitol/chloroaromatic compound transport system permease small subunit
MTQPSPTLLRIIRVIDRFSELSGKAVAWLIVPLTFGLAYEVIARYGFNEPTIWAFDLSYMLYGTLFMLGAHYALLRGAHIRTDMFWERFSDRKKGMIDAIAYLAFFFPAMIMLFFASVDEAYAAFLMGERSEQTAWRPVIYPFKAVVPATAVLLFIQGISEFIKSVYAAKTGRPLDVKEKIEV